MSERPNPTPEDLLSNSAWMRRLARSLSADPDEAEDLVQETWLAALQNPPPDSGRLPGWLGRVLRNLASKARRSNRRREARERKASRPEALPSAAELYERAQRQRELIATVLELGEPYASTLLLRFYEDLPVRAIAERQGTPVATVETRLHRGLKRLRERMGERGGERGRSGTAWMALPPLVRRPWKLLSLGAPVMKTKLIAATSTSALLALFAGLVFTSRPRGEASGTSESARAPLATLQGADAEALAPVTSPPARRAAEIAAEEPPPVAGPTSVADDDVLQGIVISDAGVPVPGAEVIVTTCDARGMRVDLEYQNKEREIARTSTDELGQFSARASPWIPLDVTVRSEGLVALEITNRFAGEHLVVELAAAGAVTGRISDAGGSAIAGATVSLELLRLRFPGDPAFDGQSDEQGMYRIEVPPGTYLLHVKPMAYEPVRALRLDIGAGETLVRDVAVEPGLVVRGRVTDARSGLPVAGAEVSHSWLARHSVRTDSHGLYVLAGLPPDTWITVYASARGYGRREARLRARAGQELRVDLELLPPREALGRVVDASGAPIAGAYVGAVARGWVGGVQAYDSVADRTDAQGRFVLRSLRSDMRHVLQVHKPGFGLRVYDFPEEETPESTLDLGEIVLREGGSLEGRIVDEDGAPRSDVHVELNGTNADRLAWAGEPVVDDFSLSRRTRTDAKGRFRFTDLAEGEYRVVGSLKGCMGAALAGVSVADGRISDAGDLVLPRGRALAGIVVDASGEPLARITVECSKVGEWARSTYTLSDAGGRFLLQGLGEGLYTLTAEPFHEDPRHTKSSFGEFAAGTADLHLVLPDAAHIKGRVLAPDGAPVAECNVAVLEGGRYGWGAHFTGSDGSFALPVPVGSVQDLIFVPADAGLQPVADRGNRTVLREVHAGAEGIAVTLPAKP